MTDSIIRSMKFQFKSQSIPKQRKHFTGERFLQSVDLAVVLCFDHRFALLLLNPSLKFTNRTLESTVVLEKLVVFRLRLFFLLLKLRPLSPGLLETRCELAALCVLKLRLLTQGANGSLQLVEFGGIW